MNGTTIDFVLIYCSPTTVYPSCYDEVQVRSGTRSVVAASPFPSFNLARSFQTFLFHSSWHYMAARDKLYRLLCLCYSQRDKWTSSPRSTKAGYRLRAAAARGDVRCFASQSRNHVAARGRTNTAARELAACRAKCWVNTNTVTHTQTNEFAAHEQLRAAAACNRYTA
jgi:hypothetical protein